MGRKKRRKRRDSSPETHELVGLRSAKEMFDRIDRLSNNFRRPDDDVSVAAVLSIKFWKDLIDKGPML